MSQKSWLEFLDEVRSIAQLGLNYSKDTYDLARYEQLLSLASEQYAIVTELPTKEIADRFRQELGYITPKVGVNGAVFSEDGKILVEKRAEDKHWGLPGGWAENGETPEQSLKREFLEETGLDVEPIKFVKVFSRLPGMFGQPHTSVHLLYLCRVKDGKIKISEESLEIGFFHINEIADWHREHREMAETAKRHVCQGKE
ncbi:MAG TPA: NUDIX hydrolase N-terminal domain-containing protein [bacterium]|nr:NUDIX hydrolase N-terminal domain-containing protein [bacterium]